MILNRTYYAIKPLLPLGLRLPLRRWWADAQRRANSRSWPIDECAGATPPGWPGWPEGKRFAFALTHDVEGLRGLAKVERLMHLDWAHGFRSSFNFVPEGEYRVPPSLRQQLDRAGFEVGVHGLEHDGKLYASKASFARKAAAINRYLREWNASGFRSPSMQHRLAWLHQLQVEYDASTFDTDPFEPEPDGYGTIFPFWVPGAGDSGYVELPYTLPQDATLFALLQERDIRIWQQKLDWIAARGGMALVDVHPDYISFEGRPAIDEYPVARYKDLLRYIRQKYEGAFWAATPRDVARYYRSAVPAASRNTRRKVCMLGYAYYKSDNRVRRYAESLAARGDQVDVIGLSRADETLGEEKIRGVASYRIQTRTRDESSKWTYAWRVLRFLVSSSQFLARRHNHIRYDVIHVHNIPDLLVFAAWHPKWTGAKIVLDIHDIVPELFASKFPGKAAALFQWLLKISEKASARFADHVIISNDLWYEKLIARSAPQEKCSVFLNHVDPEIFYPRVRTRRDGKFVMMFPGTFQWHQGLDVGIRALARLKNRIPDVELHLYGGGGGRGAEDALAELADQLGVKDRVRFFASVPLDRIPEIVSNADLGIVPKRADSFGNEAYSTKIMEFMSQGVPVVASRTRIDTFYFDDTVVRFFPSGDDEAMAASILELVENPPMRDAIVANGFKYVDQHGWHRRKKDYLQLIDRLSTETFPDSVVARTLPGAASQDPSLGRRPSD